MNKFILLILCLFTSAELFGICANIVITSPNPVCVNGANLQLRDYVKANGNNIPSADIVFEIQDFNGNRASSKVGVITDQIFRPSLGDGDYLIMVTYLQGNICEKKDSFNITVNEKPDVAINNTIVICDDSALDLSTEIITSSPSGGTQFWSGPQVLNNKFNAAGKDSAGFEGPFSLRLIYLIPATGCADTAYSDAYIQSRDKLTIRNTKPTFQFEGEPLVIMVNTKFHSSYYYTALYDSDGSFDFKNGKIVYSAGSNDVVSHNADISACVVTSLGCPMSCDSLHIQYIGLGIDKMAKNRDVVIPSVLYYGKSTTEGGEFKPALPMICKKYHLLIVNELGQVLYETTDQNAGWKGPESGTVCFYQIIAEAKSGELMNYSGKLFVSRE